MGDIRVSRRDMMDTLFAQRAGLPVPKTAIDESLARRLFPGPVADAVEGAVDFLSNPFGPVLDPQLERMKENITAKTAMRSPFGDVRPSPAGQIGTGLVDMLGSAAHPIDPETGQPDIGIAAGPLAGKGLKSLADDYINFKRMGLSDEGEAALRKTIERSANSPLPDSLPQPKPTLPDEALKAQAKKLDPESLRELKPLEVGEGAYPPDIALALRNHLKGTMGELQKATQAVEGATTEADRLIAAARASRLEADVNKLVQLQSAARSEAGRGLRVWRLMAEETTDASFWLGRAQQKAGGKLPGAKQLELNGILDEISGAATDEAKSVAKMKLAKWMNQFEQDGLTDVLLAWRKAGLVSGPKSHARNIGGNLGFGVMREVSQVPEWITDSAFSLFSKQRTVGTPFKGIGGGIYSAATKGVREGLDVVKHGMTKEMAAKYDVPRELNSIVFGGGKADKLVNGWVNYNFRVLSAEDRLFRAYAYRRGIDSAAQARAATERIRGTLPEGVTVAARAKQLAADPPKEMMAEAMYASDYAVFGNKNALASWINSGKRANEGLKVGLDLVMPYVTTPTNVFARIFEYTPVGTATTVARRGPAIWKEGLTAEQQKAVSEAVGRGATGTALMMTGWWLAEQGMLTGAPSPSSPVQQVRNASGIQPYSYKDGDEWRRINEFAPGAPVLLMGASLFEESNRPLKDEASRPDKLIGTAVQTFQEMPLMQGVESVSRAMQNPSRFAETFAREQAGTMVPTLAADIARVTDTNMRSSYGNDAGVLASAKERTPKVREQLPISRDVFGRPIATDPRHLYDPTMPRKEKDDPVLQEMVKINAGVGRASQDEGESDSIHGMRSAVRGALIYERVKERMGGRRFGVPRRQQNIINSSFGEGAKFAPKLDKRYQPADSSWSELSEEQKQREVQKIVSSVSRDLGEALEPLTSEEAKKNYLLGRFLQLAKTQPELLGGQR